MSPCFILKSNMTKHPLFNGMFAYPICQITLGKYDETPVVQRNVCNQKEKDL
nr:MAG TPA: hypothetical protein [Siphoviridae sp. cta6m1]